VRLKLSKKRRNFRLKAKHKVTYKKKRVHNPLSGGIEVKIVGPISWCENAIQAISLRNRCPAGGINKAGSE